MLREWQKNMVFLDANVILEVSLRDGPQLDAVKQFLENTTVDTAISMLTVHLVMHFGRKAGVTDELLEAIIGENELLSLMPEDYVWAALNEKGRDFEDAIQMAVAIRNGCTSFATFDKSLANAYASLADISVKLLY
jgi:predicted nucleic acid-binding protein